MKISRTGPANSSTVRRTGPTSGSGASSFAEHLSGSGEAGAAQALRGTRAATGIDSLLSVQEMGGALERESQARQRAENILDSLDEMRHALLGGRLTRRQIEKLARQVRRQREEVKDPGLLDILDQIELRAEIELAKYSTLD